MCYKNRLSLIEEQETDFAICTAWWGKYELLIILRLSQTFLYGLVIKKKNEKKNPKNLFFQERISSYM